MTLTKSDPKRRAICEATTWSPSFLHTHRFGQRLVQARSSPFFLSVRSMPRRSTHEPFLSFHGCTLRRQCCLLRTRVLLQGPWLVLGELYKYISMTNHLKHMLYTLPLNFMNFLLLKAS